MTVFARLMEGRRRAAGLAIGVVLIGARRMPGPEAQPSAAKQPGPAAPRRSTSCAERLDARGRGLLGQGKLEEAVARGAERRAPRKVRGPRHIDVAITPSNLALIYQKQGKAPGRTAPAPGARDQGAPRARRTRTLAGTSTTSGSSTEARRVRQGRAVHRRGLEVAERQARAPRARTSPPPSPTSRTAYTLQGEHARAEPLHSRALDTMEKTVGTAHPRLRRGAQQPRDALPGASRVRAGRAALPPRARDPRSGARTDAPPPRDRLCTNLAGNYQEQGAYGKAEPLFRRALEIREKAQGSTHPAVAVSLNNLADLYREQGAYAKAEPLWSRAEIAEAGLGPMHPSVAHILNNLAMLYQLQGAYAKAEPLFVRALEIKQKALGDPHPDVAALLGNLGVLYEDEGAHAKAEPLLVRALEVKQQAWGPMHPDVAISLGNLAGLYHAQGAYAKAEPLLVRALDIREKAPGADASSRRHRAQQPGDALPEAARVREGRAAARPGARAQGAAPGSASPERHRERRQSRGALRRSGRVRTGRAAPRPRRGAGGGLPAARARAPVRISQARSDAAPACADRASGRAPGLCDARRSGGRSSWRSRRSFAARAGPSTPSWTPGCAARASRRRSAPSSPSSRTRAPRLDPSARAVRSEDRGAPGRGGRRSPRADRQARGGAQHRERRLPRGTEPGHGRQDSSCARRAELRWSRSSGIAASTRAGSNASSGGRRITSPISCRREEPRSGSRSARRRGSMPGSTTSSRRCARTRAWARRGPRCGASMPWSSLRFDRGRPASPTSSCHPTASSTSSCSRR